MSGTTTNLALQYPDSPHLPLIDPSGQKLDNTPRRTTLVSKNITVLGRRTSVRLEPEMWNALKDISARESTSIHNICSLVELRKVPESSLTAAIRVFLMLYFRAACTLDGHARAGHGSFEKMKRRARVTQDMLFGTIANESLTPTH